MLREAADVDRAVRGRVQPAALPSVADVRERLARLVGPGFVARAGREHLADLPRYLQAMLRRLERLERDPGADRAVMQRLAEAEADVEKARRRLPPGHPAALREGRDPDELDWMLEELAVSLFTAGAVRTRYPVSEERVLKAARALA